MRLMLSALLLFILNGCAMLPDNAGRQATHAMAPVEDSPFYRLWRSAPGHDRKQSGFLLLDNGLDAFAARIALIRQVRRSIDMQYYLIHDDHAGMAMMQALLAAADRGVRIRILVDDINGGRRDSVLATLARHPDIQVRVFNPFGRNTGRLWQYVTGLGRQTRRAHNKSFTVDGIATIVGGRNIGDEYFERDPHLAFQDMDVLAIGPVAARVARSFDRYWNHRLSYPIGLLVERVPDQKALHRLRAHLAREVDAGYAARLRASRFVTGLRKGTLKLRWARAEVFADSPEKLLHRTGDMRGTLIESLLPALASARRELIIVSPYFVPGKAGLAFFRRLRARGVKVRVLTNSLASTDVTIVHAGYARYRQALLRMGVELWELNRVLQGPRKGVRRGFARQSRFSLHAKLFVIDRKTLFVGSLNLDPRSVVQNTEIGLLIHSSELARQVAEAFDREVPQVAFRLQLAHDSTFQVPLLLWKGRENGHDAIWDSEPHAGLWRQLEVFLLMWLPIESQI